ncbi:unnamed protein product, partial [Urochloa humidicola]
CSPLSPVSTSPRHGELLRLRPGRPLSRSFQASSQAASRITLSVPVPCAPFPAPLLELRGTRPSSRLNSASSSPVPLLELREAEQQTEQRRLLPWSSSTGPCDHLRSPAPLPPPPSPASTSRPGGSSPSPSLIGLSEQARRREQARRLLSLSLRPPRAGTAAQAGRGFGANLGRLRNFSPARKGSWPPSSPCITSYNGRRVVAVAWEHELRS